MSSLPFWINVLTLMGVYAALTMVLNVEAGWGGMWDLGIAGLFAVGAYTYTILTITGFDEVLIAPGWPSWTGILAAMAMTGIVAFLVGLPSLRARREYFLIITFAFAEVFRNLAINLESVTNGTVGFNTLTRPFQSEFGNLKGDDYRALLLGITWIVVALIFVLTRRLSRSSYGRALRAMRDNEPAAVSLGIQVSRLRLQTFVFAGVLMGGVAPFYLAWIDIVQPHVFEPELTFTVWTALVLGGIGSRFGPVLGPVAFILFTELVRSIDVPPSLLQLIAAVPQLAIGLLLVLLLRFRPEGLLSERKTFGVRSRADITIWGDLTTSVAEFKATAAKLLRR